MTASTKPAAGDGPARKGVAKRWQEFSEALRLLPWIKVSSAIFVLLAAAVGVVVAVYILVIRADNASIEDEFNQLAASAAQKFELQLFSYNQEQENLARILSTLPDTTRTSFSRLCSRMLDRYPDRRSLTGLTFFMGVSHENIPAFNDWARSTWFSSDPEIQALQEANLFLKQQATNQTSGETIITPASGSDIYYANIFPCGIESAVPPAAATLFTDFWDRESRRIPMALSSFSNVTAMSEPVELLFTASQAYVSYAPSVYSKTPSSRPLFVADRHRKAGFMDGAVLGIYVIAGITWEIARQLEPGEWVVAVEEVSEMPEFHPAGQSGIDAGDSLTHAVRDARWDDVKALLDDNNSYKQEFTCDIEQPGEASAAFDSIRQAAIPTNAMVCLAEHSLPFGRGQFLSGAKVPSRITDTDLALDAAPESVQLTVDEVHHQLDDSADMGHGLSLKQSFRVTFSNRRLNLVLMGTDKFVSSRRSNGPHTVILAGTLVSAVLLLFCFGTFVFYFSQKRLRSEKNNALVAETARQANEQTTAYAVHELRNPLHVVSAMAESCMETLQETIEKYSRLLKNRQSAAHRERKAAKMKSSNQHGTAVVSGTPAGISSDVNSGVVAGSSIVSSEGGKASQAASEFTDSVVSGGGGQPASDLDTLHQAQSEGACPSSTVSPATQPPTRDRRAAVQYLRRSLARTTEIGQDVKEVQESCSAMHRLVNDLLDLASLKKGHFKLRMSSVDLRSLMSSIVAQFEKTAAVRVLLEPIPNSVPKQITVDPLRFIQVLSNGLMNACKFTEHGSIHVTARIDWRPCHSATTSTAHSALLGPHSTHSTPQSGGHLVIPHAETTIVGGVRPETDDSPPGSGRGPVATNSGSSSQLGAAARPPASMASGNPQDEFVVILNDVPTYPGRTSRGGSSIGTPYGPTTASTNGGTPAAHPSTLTRVPTFDSNGPVTSRAAYLVITISDTGPGLRTADPEQLFVPADQVVYDPKTDRVVRPVKGSTGLGLPLARRMARAMGGDIELRERSLTKGTLYIVSIPVLGQTPGAISSRHGYAASNPSAQPSHSSGYSR